MIRRSILCASALALTTSISVPAVAQSQRGYDHLVARHAQAHGVPAALVHRVIQRESGYNARAVGRAGEMGLMQIKPATARGMGYAGAASGLLNPDTNLRYAVAYLAGAYRAAGGNPDRAVAYYQRGYHGANRNAPRGRGFGPAGAAWVVAAAGSPPPP